MMTGLEKCNALRMHAGCQRQAGAWQIGKQANGRTYQPPCFQKHAGGQHRVPCMASQLSAGRICLEQSCTLSKVQSDLGRRIIAKRRPSVGLLDLWVKCPNCIELSRGCYQPFKRLPLSIHERPKAALCFGCLEPPDAFQHRYACAQS